MGVWPNLAQGPVHSRQVSSVERVPRRPQGEYFCRAPAECVKQVRDLRGERLVT